MKEFKSNKIMNLNMDEVANVKGGTSPTITSSEPCVMFTVVLTHELTWWNSPQGNIKVDTIKVKTVQGF